MNKGKLVLGVGLMVLAITIFVVSSSANLNVFGMDYDDDIENKITTTAAVRDIHSVKADGVVSVHINVSDSEVVRYVFDDKKFKNRSSYENGILKINFSSKRKGFNFFSYTNSGVDVFVSVKSLKHIEMDGVGSIKTSGLLETDELKLVNEGTGSMKIEVAANKIKVRNAGVGSMKIKGTADTALLANLGVGSLNSVKLVVQVLDAKNDGVGSMQVYAEKEIALRNSGVGSIRYSGDAEVTSQRSDGIGSISKR